MCNEPTVFSFFLYYINLIFRFNFCGRKCMVNSEPNKDFLLTYFLMWIIPFEVSYYETKIQNTFMFRN